VPTFAAAPVLLAGLLASLIPLVLHLLRPRPGEPRPFPTVRFLTRQPWNRLRMSAPDQLLLLALRMLLLILLGAALAQPGWLPRRQGRAEIVLVDSAAAGDSAAWMRALGRAPAAADTVVWFGGYDAALARLPATARALGSADSLRVTVVSTLRAEGWTPGTGPLREAAWPGRIGVIRLPSREADPGPQSAPPGVAVLAAPGQGRYVTAALASTGLPLTSPDSAGVLVSLAGTVTPELAERVREGATAVIAASSTSAAPAVSRALRFDHGAAVVAQPAEAALPPGRVVAVWEDGAPAATAVGDGRGCRVQVGVQLESGELPMSTRFPHLVRALVGACQPGLSAPGQLDPGAVRVLAGSGPEWVSARMLGTAVAVPLGRWLLLLALLLALAESLLARRLERAT
jgi:hypothetical protein